MLTFYFNQISSYSKQVLRILLQQERRYEKEKKETLGNEAMTHTRRFSLS